MMASQYRPLTVPSNILRLITLRMCSTMTSIAEEKDMLVPEQFGFQRCSKCLCWLPCSRRPKQKDDILQLLS